MGVKPLLLRCLLLLIPLIFRPSPRVGPRLRDPKLAPSRFTLIVPCRTPVDRVIVSNIDPTDIDIALFAFFGFAVGF